MSEVHTWFGAVGVKFLACVFSATGRACFESVVTLWRRLWRARRPFSRISRSTRFLLAAKPLAQFSHHVGAAMIALVLRRDGLDQRQHLAVRQPLAIRLAAPLTGAIAADADTQNRTHLDQGKALILLCVLTRVRGDVVDSWSATVHIPDTAHTPQPQKGHEPADLFSDLAENATDQSIFSSAPMKTHVSFSRP